MDNMDFEGNLFSPLPEPSFAPPSFEENMNLPQTENEAPQEQPYDGYYTQEAPDEPPVTVSPETGAQADSPSSAPQVIEQPPVQVQPIQIPIQPFIAPPIMAPTTYTAVIPAEYQQPYYPPESMPLPAVKPMGWRAPPALVFFALLICFPVGLILLLFFTRWGAFAKTFITLFVLLCAWAIYEVLCIYQIIDLPSLIQSLLK